MMTVTVAAASRAPGAIVCRLIVHTDNSVAGDFVERTSINQSINQRISRIFAQKHNTQQ